MNMPDLYEKFFWCKEETQLLLLPSGHRFRSIIALDKKTRKCYGTKQGRPFKSYIPLYRQTQAAYIIDTLLAHSGERARCLPSADRPEVALQPMDESFRVPRTIGDVRDSWVQRRRTLDWSVGHWLHGQFGIDWSPTATRYMWADGRCDIKKTNGRRERERNMMDCLGGKTNFSTRLCAVKRYRRGQSGNPQSS